MNTRRQISLLLAIGLTVCAIGAITVYATGTATAAGEPTADTKRGNILKDKRDRTGGLTVHKVTVLDKFGRGTRILERPRDYDVEGDTSTSPTIVFTESANLSGGERVTVEMISVKPGNHDLDIEFK